MTSFDSKEKRAGYAIAPAITLILYAIILAVKGIYPFGHATIDYYDMAQEITAFYYHVYDVLHGTKGLFYDWYSALGTNMAMGPAGCSNLSPLNLFFLFVRRDHLLQSLSVFNGLKMALMSFSMFVFLGKAHAKTPYIFRIFGAVGYSFCGFMLMHYAINPWMDIAVLFPVLMLFYERVLLEGKLKGYVISLALIMICSFYLGIMCLIFLFLLTGLNTVSNKNVHLAELGGGTALSVLLSCFITVPQITQMIASARFHNSNTSSGGIYGWYIDIISHVKGDYTTRWWALLGVSLAAAVILCGLIRFRKDRRIIFMTVSLILLVTLELFFESIALFWHFGSYVQYPVRNGFLISFVFIYLMCFYAGKLFEDEKFTGYAGFIITVIGFIGFVAFMRLHPGIPLRRAFHLTSAIMAGSFLYYLVFIIKGKKTGKYLGWIAGMFACELLCYGFLLFGQPTFVTGYSEEPEQSGEYIHISNELSDAFELEPERLARIKNPDESLNANYGFILRRPALSNWTHMIAPGEQGGASSWGYSIEFTRLLDAGGTIFSDALLGVRDIISCVPMDESLYSPEATKTVTVDPATNESTDYTLYRPRYTLPFGVVISEAASGGVSEDDLKDICRLHNKTYTIVTGDPEELAKWYIKAGKEKEEGCSISSEDDDKSHIVNIHIDPGKREAIYLIGSGADQEYANSLIEVKTDDGWQEIGIPTIGEADNTFYPAHFNNNTVLLGSFDNKSVDIRITMDTDKGPLFKPGIFGISLDKMDKLESLAMGIEEDNISAGGQSLTFSVDDAKEGGALLLPLTYDEGWKIKINGKETKASSYAGLFTRIPLAEGSNLVKMDFTPPGLLPGFAITCLAALIIALFIVLAKHHPIEVPEGCRIWLRRIYMSVCFIVILLMYLIPIVCGTLMVLFRAVHT